jgi:two-component system sensor histidine kinase UhpB
VQSRSLVRAVNYACARSRERLQRRRADELQERLATIVEASRDGIVSVDPAGVIVTWNPGAERILGYAASDAVGEPLRRIVRPAEDSESADWWPSPAGGDEQSAFEGTWRTREGRTITVSVVSCALPGPGGNGGMAAVFRDITETRRRDRELREKHVALEQRDREMRALAARLNATREEERTRISRQVHDELGQLLTGIKMDLRWAGRRLPSGSDDPLCEVAHRLREAESLLDQTVTTVQRIAVELRPSVLDALGLSAAIRDEVRRFRERAGLSASARVSTGTEPDLDVATAMFRILQELLTNVARHAEATTVRVRLHGDDASWVLVVEDDGVGIPEAHARGRSLGLVGMRERAAALGGTLEVVRGELGGTIASVRIPRSAGNE